MKYNLLLLVAMLISLSMRAESMQGQLRLEYNNAPFDGNVFKKKFGREVKATCHWYVGRFFGEETVFAGITVTNTGAKMMLFHYYVAFFDKDNRLIGTADQGTFRDKGLKPGEMAEMSSCLIQLPENKYKEIVSYQAVIYETEVVPKKPDSSR